MLVRFARCCNPVPGDEITGYITRGRGVTVHKADCVNASNSEQERLVEVSWATGHQQTSFNAGITIIAYDHVSLLAEWMAYGQDHGMGQWRNSGKGRFVVDKFVVTDDERGVAPYFDIQYA
jgi:(p)ppGpp synthase/HD superfamily hydrolase